MLKISLLYINFIHFFVSIVLKIFLQRVLFLYQVLYIERLLCLIRCTYLFNNNKRNSYMCPTFILLISTLSLGTSIGADYEVTDYKHNNDEQNPRSRPFQVFPPGFLRLLNVLIRDGTLLRQFPLYGEIFLLHVCSSLHRLDKVVDSLRAADILSGQA